MKLKDILAMPEFNDFKVIAGENGLDRKVDIVTVMDAPDIEDWIRGNEFVISTGYIFKDNPEIFADKLEIYNQKGISGFGLKLDRYLKELPENIITKADELGFPIIYIPNKYPYVDIINPVLTKIIDEQADKLIRSEKIHNAFTELVIRNEGTDKILATLSKIINKDCLFIDKVFNERYYSFENEQEYNKIKNLSTEKILINYEDISLEIDGKIFGYLIILPAESSHSKSSSDSYDKIAIDHALTVLRLDQRRKIARHHVEEKYRDKFIKDLLFKNIDDPEEAISQARIYDWDFYKNYNVLSFSIDDYEFYLKKTTYTSKDPGQIDYIQDEIFSFINNRVRNIFSDYIYTTMRGSIIYLVDLEGNKNILKNLDNKIAEINTGLKEKFARTFTLGIGSQVDNLYEIDKSLKEAQKAVALSKKINTDRNIYYYTDLKYYRLLDQIDNKDLVNEFIRDNISKIINYDRENNTELLLTLEKYINNNWNTSRTAEEMYLHYNTIKQRINKIEEITGFDLADNETRFNINLAIKLTNLYNQ